VGTTASAGALSTAPVAVVAFPSAAWSPGRVVDGTCSAVSVSSELENAKKNGQRVCRERGVRARATVRKRNEKRPNRVTPELVVRLGAVYTPWWAKVTQNVKGSNNVGGTLSTQGFSSFVPSNAVIFRSPQIHVQWVAPDFRHTTAQRTSCFHL